MLFVGMQFLQSPNRWLAYWQEAILPFFVFHQPVILLIAFFVVQWDVSFLVKLPVVVVGSFLLTRLIYEGIIKRIGITRLMFGMKAKASPITNQS